MSVSIQIPTQLRPLTQGAPSVAVNGHTVEEVLKDLDHRFPGIADRIFDESGSIRRFINVYLGDENVRLLDGLKTSVGPDDALVIIPAVAGGCS